MSMPTRGLGRGLDALFSDTNNAALPQQPPSMLSLEKIVRGKLQPRKVFTAQSLEELALSIRQQGIIQPLLVRPLHENPGQYEIVAGERRWRAAQMAELDTVPVYVRDMTDQEVMLAALVENLQRENLNPIEEALALKALRDNCQITQDEIAQQLGKSRPAIANALRLLLLPAQAQKDIQSGALHAGHARALLSIVDADAQEVLRTTIIEKEMNVRDAENAAAFWRDHQSFPWDPPAPLPFFPAAQKHPVGNVIQAVKDTKDAKKTRPAPPFHAHVEAAVMADLGIQTRIIGSPRRGKIMLMYKNTEELKHILITLGVDDPDLSDPE